MRRLIELAKLDKVNKHGNPSPPNEKPIRVPLILGEGDLGVGVEWR